MTDTKQEPVIEDLAVDAPASLAADEPAETAPPPDENRGCGGRYLRDPVTGERVLIERTEPCTGCKA